MTDIEKLAVDTIRTLSMEGVQAANSGHPGTPMALAPISYLLFNEVMRYDPEDPAWPARDRFVLSCGHASMLLYSTLHLAGVKQLDESGKPTGEDAVPLEHIKNFRQLDSRCPGHPEHGHTSGVEMTTGPLGQGVSTSVGMAIAGSWLSAKYDRPDFDLFGYNVYALCSDGDMMEGISGEAASIAGHLKLSNLCWIYDDNGITIEGSTDLAFSENVAERFTAYGWNVAHVADGNDLDAMRGAIKEFQASDKPTLIVVKTQIAYGAPNAVGTAGAHGAPLGDEEIRLTKAAYGLPEDKEFYVADDVRKAFQDGVGTRGPAAKASWQAKFVEYKTKYAKEAAQLEDLLAGKLPEGWDADVATFETDAKGMASRASSGKVLNQVAAHIPWMLGGSADLAPSNKSNLTFGETGDFSADNRSGRNFHFGIREHAMGAICNGMALSGIRAYGATFFVFLDYLRPAVRLASIMELPVLYIFTHDSIGVGEDGPTHQPVEQLASLRAIPGVVVFRPGDANEVAQSYKAAMALGNRPAAMVLTRQNLPTLDRTQYGAAEGTAKGAYVLSEANGTPQVILIGTGSEVSLCLEAQAKLAEEGIAARVVSMPSWELFEDQPEEYRNSVLPPEITARVAVEAGIEQGWSRYASRFIGMKGFGASAPYAQLFEHFGITADAVVAEAKAALS